MRTLILIALLATPAAAQSFNIDVGENSICCYPAPANTYGGAASQTGVWNASIHPYSTALVDLSGAATTATTTSTNAGWYNYFPSPLLGDDYNFMVDIQSFAASAGVQSWTFSGLQNGDYALYTYAWAPDSATPRTRVTVPGSVDAPQLVGGSWGGGAHILGTTYALHHIAVTSGTLFVQVDVAAGNSGSVNGFQLVFTPAAGGPTPFCLGDGTGAACPCGNTGSAGNGCANSAFAAGGHLAATGTAGASVGTDTLQLTATNVPGPGLFFQASGLGGPILFGDGHLCATSGIVRMGVVFPTGSTATYPGGLTPNPIHIAGSTANGDVRHYQCWYRDAITFCTSDTFNLTNGVTLTWGP